MSVINHPILEIRRRWYQSHDIWTIKTDERMARESKKVASVIVAIF